MSPIGLDRRTLVAFALGALALPRTATAAFDYQWKKRPIVVFAPSESDARFVRQKTIMGGARTGFLDRDVVVIYVAGGNMTHDFGPGPGMSGSALRSRFRVSEGSFRVILIGKDGGVKLESPNPIPASDLFNEIDRMPMRRDEIRKRSYEKA